MKASTFFNNIMYVITKACILHNEKNMFKKSQTYLHGLFNITHRYIFKQQQNTKLTY